MTKMLPCLAWQLNGTYENKHSIETVNVCHSELSILKVINLIHCESVAPLQQKPAQLNYCLVLFLRNMIWTTVKKKKILRPMLSDSDIRQKIPKRRLQHNREHKPPENNESKHKCSKDKFKTRF